MAGTLLRERGRERARVGGEEPKMWKEESVARGGSAIAYWTCEFTEPWRPRSGSTIVLQHGLGLNASVWRPWLRAFPPDCTVIAIDLRGHGRSASAWKKDDYSIDELTDDVLAIMDQESVEQCHFIGESIGGTIGLNLAGRFASRVRSITVCSTGVQGAMVTNVAGWPDLVRDKGIDAWSAEFLRGRFEPGTVSPELVAWVDGVQRQLSPRAVAGIVRSLLNADLDSVLANLATPLLMIYPLGSPYVDTRNAIALRALVPFADAVFLRGARHGVVLSHWAECSAAAGAFIARVDAEPRSA
jgi:3-oxoadipate enol-lactonase